VVWVVITAVGLVAEISGIIAFGQHMTGRDDVAVDGPVVAGTVRPPLRTGVPPEQPAPTDAASGTVRGPNIVAARAIRKPADSGPRPSGGAT
jgi:hypothetical protein